MVKAMTRKAVWLAPVAFALAMTVLVVFNGMAVLSLFGSHDSRAISTGDIRDFMAAHYGKHDAANKYWTLKGDYARDGSLQTFHAICASLPTSIGGDARVLLAVCNEPPEPYTGAYYADSPGTVDLYELGRQGGKVTVTANLKDVPLDIPGVSSGSVIRLGKDLYAFDFSGEVEFHESGCGRDARELFAPRGNTFVEVLNITTYDSDGTPYEHPVITQTVEATVDGSQPDQIYYPLTLNVDNTTNYPPSPDSDKEPPATVKRRSFIVNFNPQKWSYELPADLYAGSKREGC